LYEDSPESNTFHGKKHSCKEPIIGIDTLIVEHFNLITTDIEIHIIPWDQVLRSCVVEISREKFQEDDTQFCSINCKQSKEPLFSRKIHSGARNHLIPASVEWGGLKRVRAHKVKGILRGDIRDERPVIHSPTTSREEKRESRADESIPQIN
ncbi:hypothetical protein AVEN_252128-1, partial [Araneus ventricosus]